MSLGTPENSARQKLSIIIIIIIKIAHAQERKPLTSGMFPKTIRSENRYFLLSNLIA